MVFKLANKEWSSIENFYSDIKDNIELKETNIEKIRIIGLFAQYCQNFDLKQELLLIENNLLNNELKIIKKCIQTMDKKYDLNKISDFSYQTIKNILNFDNIIIKKENKDTLNININDIMLFYECSTKSDNDKTNKIRENILLDINEDYIDSYINNENYGFYWLDIKNKWNSFLKSLMFSKNYDTIIIKKKGGRTIKYDFEIEYINNKKIIDIIKLEFKFNASSIQKLPQFLNLPESHNILSNNSYGKFFYNNYLNQIINMKLYTQEFKDINIDEKTYLKFLYQNYYDKHPLFQKLKNLEEKNDNFKKNKKKIVDESIKDFLNNFGKYIDLNKILSLFKNTQENKTFILYDCASQNFKLDTIFFKNDIKYCGIKKNNTIVIKIGNKDYYDLLLRWKNHKGILYPAWQIKKSNDNKKLCK
jgi:hypothetical protein